MKKIVIIGAGMGGLTAGNLLVLKGHKVTIFESHITPGGYTAGFWRKGYYFESGTLSFESSSLVFKAMKEIGVYERIPFVRQIFRWVGPRFDGILTTYDELRQMFLRAYPSDCEALKRYFDQVQKLYAALKPFMASTGNALGRIFGRALGGFRTACLYRKYANVTLSEFTARFFERDSELYQIFKTFGYPDMAAYILGGAIVTILHDYWTIKDGMQAWADVLAENFKRLGGELLLRAPVEKIVTKNGSAVGVISQGVYHEADVVISASDYKKTFLKLLDDPSLVPSSLMEKIANTAVSEGICTVYLGLALPTSRLAGIMKVPHVIYIDEKPGAERRDPTDEQFFEKTSVTIYSPSVLNPKLSPEDHSSLMLQAVAPTHWMGNWGGGDRERYRSLKERVKAALIRKASSVIPNLESHIEFADVATPLTYERYTQNTDGATSAWSWNPKNKFYESLLRTYTDTPIRNLYIGSCWSTQIGGVPSAISAAYKCVKKI